MLKLIPWWIKLAAFGALCAALAWGTHLVLEHFRQEGRDEIQKKWNADIAERDERWSGSIVTLSNNWAKEKDRADAITREQDALFEIVTSNVAHVHRGGGIVVPDDVVRVSNDAGRIANREHGDAAPAAPGATAPAAVSAIPGTKVYDERDIAAFLEAGPKAYDTTVQFLDKCYADENALYDSLVKLKGGM